MRTVLVSTLVSTLAFAAAAAAAQRAPAASESIEIRVVEVPVNVVGRDGAPVRELGRGDFELFEDGKRREITHFEAIDLRQLPAAGFDRVHPAARRSFLVLFDLSNSNPHALGKAIDAARWFVDEGLEPRDLAAVATWSVERGFRLLTAFTTDRSLLRGAVHTLGNPKFFRTTDPLLLAADVTLSESAGTRASQRDQDYLESVTDLNRGSQRADEAWKRGRIEQQLASFGWVARLLDSLPGRKQVVLLSEGFDARLLHGQEDLGSAATRESAQASIAGEIWKVDNDQRFGNVRSASSLDAMSELFRRSDVTLHAMDIQGLRTNVSAREGRRENSNESLFLLANGTGGVVFKNSNDVAESFGSMLRQQEVTYVLGFQTSGRADPNRFHTLEVRVKDAPRGTKLLHRPGYYEEGTESGIERALSAVTVLVNDIPRDDIRIDPVAFPMPASSGRSVVPVILEIDGTSMLEGHSGATLDGELFVYAFDEQGSVLDFLFQRVGLDLTKIEDSLRSGGLKFYGALSLPPGRYAVKSLFRTAQTSRDGFRRVDVVVPEPGTAAVAPPMAIGSPEGWVLIKAAPRSPDEAEYPFTIASESFVPDAVPDLRNGEGREVAVFTWHVPVEGLQIGGGVRNEAGERLPAKLALLGRTPDDHLDPAKLLFKFQPERLPAGAYALELDIRDSRGTLSETVSMPFRIH